MTQRTAHGLVTPPFNIIWDIAVSWRVKISHGIGVPKLIVAISYE